MCNDSTVTSEPKVRLKRRKEEVGCVEDKQRMDAVKEKAIEAIMRYCDSLYFKENTIEEKLNGKEPKDIVGTAWIKGTTGFCKTIKVFGSKGCTRMGITSRKKAGLQEMDWTTWESKTKEGQKQ
ncbi:hypothetical protein Tco_1294097 [Tanacetum coccineum]